MTGNTLVDMQHLCMPEHVETYAVPVVRGILVEQLRMRGFEHSTP